MTKDQAKRILINLDIGTVESIWFFELCIEYFKLDTDDKRAQFAEFCAMTEKEYRSAMNEITMQDIHGGNPDDPQYLSKDQ